MSQTKAQLVDGQGDAVFDTDTLVVDSTNDRVGINTSSPARPLHVNSGAIDTVAKFESSDSAAIINIVDGDNADGVSIGSLNGHTTFRSGLSTERMRLTSSGDLGIGITPTERFHVYHPTANVNAVIESGDANAYLAFKDSSTNSTASVYLGAAANDMKFATNGVEQLRLASNGRLNVGINASTTSQLMSIGRAAGGSYVAYHIGNANYAFMGSASGLLSGGIGSSTDLCLRSENKLRWLPMVVV